MRRPLWRLPRLWWLHAVVLVPVLLPVGEQWGQLKRRQIQQQRKAQMVASRFLRGVHAC